MSNAHYHDLDDGAVPYVERDYEYVSDEQRMNNHETSNPGYRFAFDSAFAIMHHEWLRKKELINNHDTSNPYFTFRDGIYYQSDGTRHKHYGAYGLSNGYVNQSSEQINNHKASNPSSYFEIRDGILHQCDRTRHKQWMQEILKEAKDQSVKLHTSNSNFVNKFPECGEKFSSQSMDAPAFCPSDLGSSVLAHPGTPRRPSSACPSPTSIWVAALPSPGSPLGADEEVATQIGSPSPVPSEFTFLSGDEDADEIGSVGSMREGQATGSVMKRRRRDTIP